MFLRKNKKNSLLSLIYPFLKANRHNNKNSSCEGFSFAEIIISIIILEAFLFGTAQALVIATAIRVKAQRVAQVTQWIQEEIENVQYLGTIYQNTTVTSMTNTTVTIGDATDFNTNDKFIIRGDSKEYTATSVNKTTRTLTLASGNTFQKTSAAGSRIIATNRCSINQSSLALGFADGLRDKILSVKLNRNPESGQSSNFVISKNLSGKTYYLKTTLNIRDEAPYSLLELRYEASTDTNPDCTTKKNCIAEFNTQIVPDAAFYCL